MSKTVVVIQAPPVTRISIDGAPTVVIRGTPGEQGPQGPPGVVESPVFQTRAEAMAYSAAHPNLLVGWWE